MGAEITQVVEVYDRVKECWKAEFGDLVEHPGFRHNGELTGEPPHLDPHSIALAERRHPGKTIPEMTEDERYGPYHISQNYRAYAVLADVRNYDKDIPVCQPRGLPADISEPTFKLHFDERKDAYSESFLTVEDLLAYDWERKVTWYDWKANTFRKSMMRNAGDFQRLRLVMERMQTLGDPKDVRLVFWFTG